MIMECKVIMECKDQFEVSMQKEDIECIRKLLFRKRFRPKQVAFAFLAVYGILVSFRVHSLWNEPHSAGLILYAFLDGAIFIAMISYIKFLLKWNRQKKLEISRCGMRHIEIKVFDEWFSVSQYFEDWKSGEIYVRPQDIDIIWRDSNYTVLLRENGIICSLRNTWLTEHPELERVLSQKVPTACAAQAASDSDNESKQNQNSSQNEDLRQETSKKKQIALEQIALIVICACIGAVVGYEATNAFNAGIQNSPEIQRYYLEFGLQFPTFHYKECMMASSILLAGIPTGLFLYAPFNKMLIRRKVCLPARILIGILGFPSYTCFGTALILPFFVYKIIVLLR